MVNKLANINFVQILTIICNITKFRWGQFQIQEVLCNMGHFGLLRMSRTVFYPDSFKYYTGPEVYNTDVLETH